MKKFNTKNLAYSGLFLALAMILPFVTGQIPHFGKMLCPMHIPVLFCGIICGPIYGGLIGAIAPLLRFICFGMPPIFPTGLAMCFELAAYGIVIGVFWRKTKNIWISLFSALISGRIIWGLIYTLFSFAFNVSFSFSTFLTAGFITAIPGIVLQIILIPSIIFILNKRSS